MKKPILAALLVCLLLAGCTPALPEPTATPVPVVTSTPTPEQTPTPTPTPTPPPEVPDDTPVNVQDYIPSVFVDLRYATTNNFTGQVIYDFTEAQLRYGTVKKLAVAAEALAQQGYALLIWDACRPVSAQFRLWEVCPNGTYVANPNTGYSAHSRGNTIDLTLVRSDGTEIPMPSGFDEFSALADRDYSDVSHSASENARLLEAAMQAGGFVAYSAEWWHYRDSTVYDVVLN